MWGREVERPKIDGDGPADDGKHGWSDLDLAELEAEVFLIGQWKNFAEIEESLSLPELEAILEAARHREHERNKFAAALKGVDLEDNETSTFDEVEARARAKLAGKTLDEYEMDDLGFGVEAETEE